MITIDRKLGTERLVTIINNKETDLSNIIDLMINFKSNLKVKSDLFGVDSAFYNSSTFNLYLDIIDDKLTTTPVINRTVLLQSISIRVEGGVKTPINNQFIKFYNDDIAEDEFIKKASGNLFTIIKSAIKSKYLGLKAPNRSIGSFFEGEVTIDMIDNWEDQSISYNWNIKGLDVYDVDYAIDVLNSQNKIDVNLKEMIIIYLKSSANETILIDDVNFQNHFKNITGFRINKLLKLITDEDLIRLIPLTINNNNSSIFDELISRGYEAVIIQSKIGFNIKSDEYRQIYIDKFELLLMSGFNKINKIYVDNFDLFLEKFRQVKYTQENSNKNNSVFNKYTVRSLEKLLKSNNILDSSELDTFIKVDDVCYIKKPEANN